jgi:cell division cycle 14
MIRKDAVVIIPNFLYFITLNEEPNPQKNESYFSTDSHLMYRPYAADFGPLNLACVFRYCDLVDTLYKVYFFLFCLEFFT